jgi:carboxyl-terminal processing protease
MDNGFLKVIAPIDGSPAAEAGMQSGDVILKLDGIAIKGMSLERGRGQDARPEGQRDRS